MVVKLYQIVRNRCKALIKASLGQSVETGSLELHEVLLHVGELLFAELAHVGSDLTEHLVLLLGGNLSKNRLTSAFGQLLSHIVGELLVFFVVELGEIVADCSHFVVDGDGLSEHVASLISGLDLSHVVLKLVDITGTHDG